MLNLLRLAGKFFLRSLKRGEWNIIIFATLLAVASLTAIHTTIDRIQRAIYLQTTTMIGADAVITSATQIPEKWFDEAYALKLLKTQSVIVFPTMLSEKNRLQLVSVTAVTENYPLRGKLLLNTQQGQKKLQGMPKSGEIWVEPRLITLLQLHLNDMVRIGKMSFRITGVLVERPDIDVNWFNVAPSVMMKQTDAVKSGVIGPGSRLQYRMMVSGESTALKILLQMIAREKNASQTILTAQRDQGRLHFILQQAENYLNWIAMIVVILAALAIASSAFRFSEKQSVTIQLLNYFGHSSYTVLGFYSVQFLFASIIAVSFGLLLGFGLQWMLAHLFTQYFQIALPNASLIALSYSSLSGIILLCGFSIPALLQQRWVYGLLIIWPALLILLMHFSSYQAWFYLLMICAISSFIFVIALSAIFKLIELLPRPLQRPWKYGLLRLVRNASQSILQITAIGLVLVLFQLMFYARNYLFSDWLSTLAPNTPNYFIINIFQHDLPYLKKWVDDHFLRSVRFYPIVKGRLVALNHKPILEAVLVNARSNNALHRELNLTWGSTFPSDNKIVAGRAWDEEDDASVVSIEIELAKKLGIHLNDTVRFQLGDENIQAKVVSMRQLQWQSFHPNFYFVFPKPPEISLPVSYMTSFYLPDYMQEDLPALLKKLPNLTVFDVSHFLKQAQNILSLTIKAVSYLLILTGFAAVLVLISVWLNSASLRQQEATVFRLLSMDAHYLMGARWSETIFKILLTLILSFLFTFTIEEWLMRSLFYAQ